MPVGQLAHLDMSELISMPCWLGVGDLGHSQQARTSKLRRAAAIGPEGSGLIFLATHRACCCGCCLFRFMPSSAAAVLGCCLLPTQLAPNQDLMNLLIRKKGKNVCKQQARVLSRACSVVASVLSL